STWPRPPSRPHEGRAHRLPRRGQDDRLQRADRAPRRERRAGPQPGRHQGARRARRRARRHLPAAQDDLRRGELRRLPARPQRARAAHGARRGDRGAAPRRRRAGRGVAWLPRRGGRAAHPAADLGGFAAELVLADLAVVEKRLERLKKEKGHERERALLERLAPSLEAGTPLRTLGLAPEERVLLAGFAFLSLRPLLVVLNVPEAAAAVP